MAGKDIEERMTELLAKVSDKMNLLSLQTPKYARFISNEITSTVGVLITISMNNEIFNQNSGVATYNHGGIRYVEILESGYYSLVSNFKGTTSNTNLSSLIIYLSLNDNTIYSFGNSSAHSNVSVSSGVLFLEEGTLIKIICTPRVQTFTVDLSVQKHS